MTGAEPFLQSHRHLQFMTTNIYKCLAPCKECTGNYISEILKKRFICNCRCHAIRDGSFDSTTSSTSSSTSPADISWGKQEMEDDEEPK